MTEDEKKEIASMVLKEIKKHSIDYRNKQIVWSNQDEITLMERSKVRIPVIDDRGVPPFYGNMDCQTLLEAYGLRKSEKLTASATASAEQAKQSEANAKASESNAKDSEENALSAAGRASASEENAKSSEIESKSSAESASSSAIIAGQKADEAASSASDASSSASSAAESKADATSAKEGAIAAKNSAESLKNEMQQSLDTAIEQAISAISLKLHPIGSYFISDKEDNPGSLFGGTWESVRDVMLIGAGNKYVAGSTGGNDTHTLSKDEMPSHNHGEAGAHAHSRGTMNITGWINIPKANNEDTASSGALYSSGGSVRGNSASWGGTCLRVNLDASKSWTGSTSSNGSHTHSTEGSSKPFSILNPYRAVYIWRRIA